MNAGTLIVVLYWLIFTVRKHYTPKIAAAIRTNAYDLNRATPDEARAVARKGKPLTVAKWALRVGGWAENALAVLMLIVIAHIIGAIITGTVVVLGYPI